MNSIGIFGDSFADPSHGHDEYRQLMFDGWMYYLQNYDPIIFAKGGSSVYYSYKKFIENHHYYDRVIFLATQPQRIFNSNITFDGEELRVPGYDHAEFYLNTFKNLNTEQIETLGAIKEYYLYLMNYSVHLDISEALIYKIKNIRPDTLFINVFYDGSIKNKKIPIYKDIQGPAILNYLDLVVSSLTDVKGYDFPHRKVQGILEQRLTCHLTKEVNQLLGTHINEMLKTNVWNPNIPSFVKHEVQDLDYYYKNFKLND
jgi:hypothetical protein